MMHPRVLDDKYCLQSQCVGVRTAVSSYKWSGFLVSGPVHRGKLPEKSANTIGCIIDESAALCT